MRFLNGFCMRKLSSIKVCVATTLLLSFNMGNAAQIDIGKTLKSLLEYAKKNSQELATMRLESQATAEKIIPAGALADPKLRIELQDITKMGSQNPSFLPGRVGGTKYTVMQDLPWYGKRDLKRQIAELDVEGANGRVHDTWNDIALQVKVAYAQWFYIKQTESLTKEIIELMVRLEKIAQSRYASGLAAQQDIIRAQVEQTGMRSELINLENEAAILQAKINALIGRSVLATLASPEGPRALPAPVKLDFGVLQDRIRGNNPALYIEDIKIKSAEKNRELNLKNRYPDFTLGISPIQNRNSVREWEVMFEVNIPLQQSPRRSMEREAELMVSAAKKRKDAVSTQIFGSLAEALSGIETARRLESQTINNLLPQAELTFSSALVGYENGKVDFGTLLDAQQQIRRAKMTRIKVQTDAQMRLAEIERLVGDDL